MGYPVAIATRLVMLGKIGGGGGGALAGVHVPTAAKVYEPVLAALAREGIAMQEKERWS